MRSKMNKVNVLVVLMVIVVGAAGACPGVKWKGGKQTVECRQRGLITLPSNIDPQTQVLDLSGSNFQTLPREAFMRANLLNLQKVYLASCKIGHINESALHGLTNLVELDLSDNLLTDIPSAALKDATSLRELRLAQNPIQKIEAKAFVEASGLVKLDLSDCQIEVIVAGAFDGLDGLAQLRLGGNRLEELRPDVVTSLPGRLHGLELQGNPWICDCRLRYLREWLIEHNVPSPATAACRSPERLMGRALTELQVDDFACPPQVIPPPAPATSPLMTSSTGGGSGATGQSASLQVHVEAAAGENATLTCRMSGVPMPEITWLWRGRVVENASRVDDDQQQQVLNPLPVTEEGMYESDFGTTIRTVLILEEGKYEKTSRLILSPAHEADSGEFVCVASNAAGTARLNLTLRVDVAAPVVGGLGGAQIAGLGAGLFILLATVVAILLAMLIRTRSSSSKHQQQSTSTANRPTAGQSSTAGVAKSPSLSAMEYGQFALVKQTASPNQVVVVRAMSPPSSSGAGPDLIYDARTNSYTTNGLMTASDYAILQRNHQQQELALGAGDYQSAQTDSFYPSALWDHVLPPLTEEDRAVLHGSSSQQHAGIPSPIHLPHVPLSVAEVYNAVPISSGQIIANPLDRDGSDGAESVSVDSYSLPCRIPTSDQQQQQQHQHSAAGFVPYPPDYGLPITQSPPLHLHREQQQEQQIEPCPSAHPAGGAPAQQFLNSSGSCYGSKASNSSAESSPASSSPAAKSPRFWQQRPGGGNNVNIKQRNHHFARDSPDEGYQEECATDV